MSELLTKKKTDFANKIVKFYFFNFENDCASFPPVDTDKDYYTFIGNRVQTMWK